MKIIINGIGIAGPSLAFWLRRGGHEVLLVEAAPQFRRGGYVVDFWGAGYDIAEKMGILPRIRTAGYQVREVRFVDRRSRKRGGFSVESISHPLNGRFTSLRRSDISAAIYDALEGKVETIFGDSVAAIDESDTCVRVSFDHSAAREADLVIGADGLHSRMRRLMFGEDSSFQVSLGYHVAALEVQGYQPRDELVYVSYGIPGRQVSRFAMRQDRTLFLFVFRDEYLAGKNPTNDQQRRAALTSIFANAGWECPEILAAAARAESIYFDHVSQIRMESWTRGRVALVGDAAACVSLMAGEGCGLAMAQAYVLAGELCTCGGDYKAALLRYQHRMMPMLKRKQQSAARFASSFAPGTGAGIAFRNLVTRLLRFGVVFDFALGKEILEPVELPDYGFTHP